MTCDEMGEILQEMIDGEASPETAKIAREHLAKCSGCAREFEEMSALAGTLRQTLKVTADGNQMRRAVLANPSVSGRRSSRHALRLWFEVAAMFALVIGVVWLNYKVEPAEDPASTPLSTTVGRETPGTPTGQAQALFPRRLNLTVLATGAISGIAEPRQIAIKEYSEWSSLDQELSAAGVKLARLDTTSSAALALFSGALTSRTGGKYLVPRFIAILETPERLEAHYAYAETALTDTEGPPDQPLTPFVICSIPKTTKPVIFIQERK